MGEMCAEELIHGASWKWITRSTATLSSSDRCSFELTWKNSGNAPMTSSTKIGVPRNYSAWVLRKILVSSKRSSKSSLFIRSMAFV